MRISRVCWSLSVSGSYGRAEVHASDLLLILSWRRVQLAAPA